ncbi:MAG TPA: ribonuclease H-like YkuK family protein [Candidatus Paceibacterota bacterium]|nr:ribonuclease H-like YkuK family protein [Candidatus Paceibacterota bacterium]
MEILNKIDLSFSSAFGLQLDVKDVVAEILRFMESNPRARYKIIIGTDSELLSDKNADFVTAIVVHRVGNGGRYFWRRLELGKFHTIRDRIIREVLLSLEVARLVLSELKDNQKSENWTFEIHADVGENGPTSTLIQEVVGMIRASNFEVKTKPESYAASKVADRHV